MITIILSFFSVPIVNAGNTTKQSSADAELYFPSPDDNIGGTTIIYIDSLDVSYGILKFIFSDIPSGATITSATLSVYYRGRLGDPTGRTYWAYRTTQTDWTEMGVTWNSYDGTNNWLTAGGDYTLTDGSSITLPENFGWVDWDVTNQVQYDLDNANKTADFLIVDNTTGVDYQWSFWSRDYAIDPTLRPKLQIEWTEPPSPSPSPTPSPSNNIAPATPSELTTAGPDLFLSSMFSSFFAGFSLIFIKNKRKEWFEELEELAEPEKRNRRYLIDIVPPDQFHRYFNE